MTALINAPRSVGCTVDVKRHSEDEVFLSKNISAGQLCAQVELQAVSLVVLSFFRDEVAARELADTVQV